MADQETWVHSIHVDLPNGNAIDIRVKKKVSAAEFELIRKIFELAELAFLADKPAEITKAEAETVVNWRRQGGDSSSSHSCYRG